MRIWANWCVKVVLAVAAMATAAAVCDKNGEDSNGGVAAVLFRPDPDKYYWIEHVESGLVLEKAVDRGEAFEGVDPDEYGWSLLSFDAPLKLASSSENKNSSFAHWRFVPLVELDDDGAKHNYYALVNRGCGQYVSRNLTTTVVSMEDEDDDEEDAVVSSSRSYATLISAESISDLDARLDLPHFQCADGGSATTSITSGTGTNNQSNDDHVLIYMNNYKKNAGDNGDARTTTTYATCFSSQAPAEDNDDEVSGETSPPCFGQGEKVGFLLPPPPTNNNATNNTMMNGTTTTSPAAVWRIRVVTNYTKADYYRGEDVQGGMTNIFAPNDDDGIVGTAEAASASIALTGTALEEAEERRNNAKKCTSVRSAKGRAMCGVGFAMVGTGLQLADVVVPSAIENDQDNKEEQQSSVGKMEQLRADVERIATQMSETGRVTNEVEELQDALDAALRYMFRGYAREKARLIEEQDFAELDDLADTLLQDRAEGLKSKIRDTFRSTYVGPPDVAAANAWQDPSMILFGYEGFDLLKMSVMQTMAMFQEAILLDVYSKPTKSCEVAVDEADLEALAEEYKSLLQDAQQGFIDVRLANIEIAAGTVDSCGPVAGLICTLDYSYREVRDPYLPAHNFLGQLRDDDNDDDIYERSLEFFQDTFNRSVPLYRAELEHDIRTWSYPITNEVAFLENYINRTLQACQDLQTDSEARAAYETSLQVFAADSSSTSAGGEEDDYNVGVEDDSNNASSNNDNGESGNNTTEAAGTINNGGNSFDNIAETSGAHCATSSVFTAISTAAGLFVLVAAAVASSLGGGGGCFCW